MSKRVLRAAELKLMMPRATETLCAFSVMIAFCSVNGGPSKLYHAFNFANTASLNKGSYSLRCSHTAGNGRDGATMTPAPACAISEASR